MTRRLMLSGGGGGKAGGGVGESLFKWTDYSREVPVDQILLDVVSL